ncbi:MAG: hypothetical protein EBU84_12395 [Actinobacteria bacterium]|nr:hypothetical protein [Actinomycetota bacterium]
MSVLEDLGGYLDTQLASLTLGTNLFYSLLPETVDNAVALYENAGAPPNFTMGSTNLPQMERPQVQALVRNNSYSSGRTVCENVYRTLTAIANQTINGNRYLRVEALGMPTLLERDVAKRVVFTMNFDVVRLLATVP